MSLSIRWAKFTIGSSTRSAVYRMLSNFIRNRVELYKALEEMIVVYSKNGRRPGDPKAVMLRDWLRKVRAGLPFSEAIDGWVPASDQMHIQAGEGGSKGDGLSKALDSAVALNDARKAMQKAVMGSVGYPAILLGIIAYVLHLMASEIIPAFAAQVPISRWTGSAASFAQVSNVIRDWWVLILIGVGAFGFSIGYSLPRWKGTLRVLFDRLPPWSIYRIVNGCAFLVSLAALIEAGRPLNQALEDLAGHASPWMKKRIEAILEKVETGDVNIGMAMEATGFEFPDPNIIDQLRIYGNVGDLATSITTVAREWIETGVDRVKTQASVLNTAALFFVFSVVVWIVKSIQELVAISQAAARGF